jgi:sugar/nucleoside kinase (ribokinase family)
VKRFDVLTIGETLVDCIAQEKGMPLSHVTHFKEYLGGSPANIACAVSCLGGRSALISKVGNDAAGQMCLQELAKAHVDTTTVYIEPTLPTSRAYVSRTEGTPEFRIARAADATLHSSELNMDTVTQAGVIHASAFSLSLDPLRSSVIAALTHAHTMGTLVSLDPNFHPQVWPDRLEALQVLQQLYPLVSLTKPSLDDAIRLFGPGLTHDAYLDKFLMMGAKLVVLTSGPEYVLVGDHHHYRAYVPVPPTQVADVTGAGDWFWAAFLMAHLDGLPHLEAIRFAIKIAAHKISTVGPISTRIERKTLYPTLYN